MSGAGDGLVINEQAVTEVAERIPVKHGDAARRTTAALPVGQLFGNSPAARSLAETWRLAVDHHRLVTESLEQDLVELRQALHAVVDNTAASEAESAARYTRAAQDFATVAERSAADLAVSTEGFTATHGSEVADELAEQYRVQVAESTTGEGQDGLLDGMDGDVDSAAAPAADSPAQDESLLGG